ncbi:MAG TPA: redoxin domain-containing protein [Thermoanaerobaculia bacterium]|nr:redoxin domain-containing protein [Thermoanaerobaculia bacterium]
MRGPAVGENAPNFDLSSTEGVLLMLRDECVHTALVLYFSSALDERTKLDLTALGRAQDSLGRLRARPLAISKAPMPQLLAAQRELGLLFPLLRDDRSFLPAYGVTAETGAEPALFLIDRGQNVLWKANPVGSVEAVLPALLAKLKAQPSARASYPKKVINRLVERWVGR